MSEDQGDGPRVRVAWDIGKHGKGVGDWHPPAMREMVDAWASNGQRVHGIGSHWVEEERQSEEPPASL